MLSTIQKSPASPILSIIPKRLIGSKSERNKSTRFIGKHKQPRTDEQRERMHGKHKPFVLGRDNVTRFDEPIKIPQELLDMKMSDGAKWRVKRTATGHLPVYTEYKNGRGRIETVIRRIEGPAQDLANDLEKIFSHNSIEVRQPQNQIVISGNVQRSVRYWFNAVGL